MLALSDNIKKIILSFILIFSSVSFAHSPVKEGFADIVETLTPGVVNINTVKYVQQKGRSLFPRNPHFEHFEEFFEHFGLPFMDELPSNPKATSLGSGFIIDPNGYIVTNHHVIKDADEIHVKTNDNRDFAAKVIGSDHKTDIALLKVESKTPLPFVIFGDSEKSRVGDWVIAIGNPFGLGGTVTAGIISSKSRDIDISPDGLVDDYIQTDAAINGGNSGGPMFNMKGEVVGVNTAILAPTGTNVGIGFATPSNTVKNIVSQLKEHGNVQRGRLSIRIQELTPEIAEGLGITKDTKGVLVAGVDKGGSGDKAGIHEGDIVIEYEGEAVKSASKLHKLVAKTPINKQVTIKVLRKGKEKILKAKIKEYSSSEFPKNKEGKITEKTFTFNDVEFSEITSEIADRFSINEHVGVVVLSNRAKNMWKSLGRGDVITSVNQKKVNNLAEFKLELEKTKKSNKKNIVFLIRRSSMTIFLALPM